VTNVVKAPIRYHNKQVIKGREIWDQEEPPSEMVWDVCVYTRSGDSKSDDMRCHRCPRWEDDDDYGKVQRMCYGIAAEACRVVFAWQKRLAKP
jgi:hypothetical protein